MLNVKVSCAYIYIMTLLSFYLTYSQLYLVQYQKQFETMYRVKPTVNHVTFVFTLRTNELLFYTHGIKHLSHINLKPVLFFQQYNIDLCLVGETIRYIASNISKSCKNKCICLHVKSIAVSASQTFLATLVVHGSFLHVYQLVSLGPVKHKSMLNVLFRMNSICLTRILCLLKIIF